MQAFGPFVPTMVGGAADLVHSTFTEFEGDAGLHARRTPAATSPGASASTGWAPRVNGLALHGGIVKPFGSTFFVFTDYMRPPIRLSALMRLDVVWIFSHDSVAVGEDGPTHQPIEHLAAMRAIPNLTVIRPADANEAAEAWRAILEEHRAARSASCSRARTCRSLDRSVVRARRRVCAAAPTCSPTPTRPTSCSSRPAPRSATALAARDLLAEQGVQARVVSMPSWELFEAQSADYRDEVLPRGRAEDLGRGRLDVRLVALGRRLDRDRQLRRLGQGRQGARALRDQPARRSPSASRRSSPSSPRL